QSFSYSGFSYASGRSCRQPESGCDCQGCSRCGLDAFANGTLQNEITRKQGQVTILNQAIGQVGGCCASGDSDGQLSCIEAIAQTAAQAYN
ncbi:MAG: hypothetical protein PHF11_04910, partial [Candidatus Omnitrophica bacterium]|nr:hypothetical protein [Candidatus Omnitrophota bacterium]